MKYKLTVIIPTFEQAERIHIGLDSIPADPRVEILVIDDGSQDGTSDVVRQYMENHPDKDIRLLGWDKNKGVSYAVNEGLDNAQGEYVVLLGSDGDFFLKGKITEVLDNWLDGADLVFYDLVDNNGHIRRLNGRTMAKYPGAVKFMRREFVGNTRCPVERRRAEDVIFTKELLEKKPHPKFIHQVIKHYNYPREGSLTWNARHGITDSIGNPL